ncbi:MAG: xanthine dehydrogenase molybdenum-binding subunit XdhA [Ktedonobacteraceae bacterium]
MELEVRINGMVAGEDVAPNESLLSLLRRRGYNSVKHGCETGECGACTVLVDGVPRPSCVMLAAQVGGCTLTTVESLGSSDNLHALQAAFVETGAVQCGFCTPGMLLSAHALLKNNPAPTEEDVREALSGNLCRCSGYVKPVRAVLRAAARMRGEDVQPLTYNTLKVEDALTGSRPAVSGTSEKLRSVVSNGSSPVSTITTKIPAMSTLTTPSPAVSPASSLQSPLDVDLQVIGQSVPALNAVKMTTGRAAFAADVQLQGMLYGRILTSPHAHAVISSIDVSKAKALPGVYAILTYRDVPRVPYTRVERVQVQGEETGVQDQYCLDYIVRYVGDRVAAVVAETAEVAEEALRLIEVEYQVLPPLLDPRQATEPNAPRIHPENESQGILDASRNIAARMRVEIGDVSQGFAASDHVLEAEYLVPATQHASLETHVTVTYFDEDDMLVVRTNSMLPHHIRRTLAQTLGIPMRRIRVVKPDVGGRARQELVLEDICALLTMATHRPVKLEYSRADEFHSNSLCQQTVLRLKTGVRRDGTILATQMVLLADTGAYATHALVGSQSVMNALALYPCPNTRFVAEVLYTNHPPAGDAQGYELAPAFFALESHIDDVARQIGMDALALRRKNWIRTGDVYPLSEDAQNRVRTVIESCGLPNCLRIVEERLHWAEKRGRATNDRFRHGVGVALSLQGDPSVPIGMSGALIKLNEDGSFDVFVGRSENGIGTVTLVAQIAAEVLGVAVDNIAMHTSDTCSVPFETNTNDFSAFYSDGGAVKRAAEQIRRQILSVAGRMLNARPEMLKMGNGVVKNMQGQQVTVAQVAAHAVYAEARQIMTTASSKVASVPMTFAAQGVEVEVDFETGVVRVLKAISAVDVGHPINPMLLEGQIQGSMTQSLSMSVCEELAYDQNGVLLTTNLQDYHIFSATDVPEMQTYLVETSDSSELFGAKSVATIPFYGMGPAIANAVLDAADIRIRQLPLTPERVLRALHAHMARR